MIDPSDPFADLFDRDKRYPPDAYEFVLRALEFAQLSHYQEELLEADEEEPVEQHVTGQQLCESIRLFALDQYGLTARSVLNHWGIHSTSDFGEIVFNMIEIKKMKKNDQDRREDFDDVYDFEEGLVEGFKITMPKTSEGKWA